MTYEVACRPLKTLKAEHMTRIHEWVRQTGARVSLPHRPTKHELNRNGLARLTVAYASFEFERSTEAEAFMVEFRDLLHPDVKMGWQLDETMPANRFTSAWKWVCRAFR